MPNSFTLTIQSSASILQNQNKAALEYLDELGIIFGSATRTAFAARNRIGKTDKNASQLEKEITKQLEQHFGISNTEAKNAYANALAVYDSQAALVDIYIDEKYALA